MSETQGTVVRAKIGYLPAINPMCEVYNKVLKHVQTGSPLPEFGQVTSIVMERFRQHYEMEKSVYVKGLEKNEENRKDASIRKESRKIIEALEDSVAKNYALKTFDHGLATLLTVDAIDNNIVMYQHALDDMDQAFSLCVGNTEVQKRDIKPRARKILSSENTKTVKKRKRNSRESSSSSSSEHSSTYDGSAPSFSSVTSSEVSSDESS